MIQNALQNIGGVGIYGVISIGLFFLVFGGALVWAFRQKKPFLRAMSALPLQDDARQFQRLADTSDRDRPSSVSFPWLAVRRRGRGRRQGRRAVAFLGRRSLNGDSRYE